ncbi:MAG: hypothetical protein H0T76_17790 [Nannocystis sp.]|nr:hypothetical protein [Nannocystis sp.]MBA3548337.1 hypothetical protein [Nannocystis sp.]
MRGLALGTLVLAACMSGGGPASTPAEPTAAPPTTTPAAPYTATATGPLTVTDVVCERAVRCGTIGRSQLGACLEGPGRSRLALVWGYDHRFDRDGLVARGRLTLEHGDPQACLSFLASAPCGVKPISFPKACGYTGPTPELIAAVAPGGTCEHWQECIDGFCTAQTACEGVCVARSPQDGPCDSNQICRDDAYCWEGRCRPRTDIGAACGGHWQWCKDGLICDGYRPGNDSDHDYTREQPGRCSAGKLLGEGCVPPATTASEVCVAPLFCDWGSDQPVCREHLSAGAQCRWLDACADGLACVGLTLGGRHHESNHYGVRKPGRCTPALDAGDACDPSAFITGCPAAMVCDLQRRVCRSTGHAGDPCVSVWLSKPPPDDVPSRNDSCFGDLYCDPATRTCKPELAKGARCTPVKFGVEDSPCYLGECDPKTRRCAPKCPK